MTGEGCNAIPACALLSPRTADTQLGPVEVPESCGAELGWEPRRVQVQGRAGVLHHHPIQSTQPLRTTHVLWIIVLIIGYVESILVGLETGHLGCFRRSLASIRPSAIAFL